MQFLYKEGHLNRGDDHLNCGGITPIVVGTGLITIHSKHFYSSTLEHGGSSHLTLTSSNSYM